MALDDRRYIIMFGTRYFGLRGTPLNVGVGILAGLDFL